MSKLHHAQGTDKHVMWWCPGCQSVHTIAVTGAKCWQLNGSDDAPTFSPSVLIHKSRTSPRCHVFIKNGVIEYLGDCEHALANSKVPMLDWRGWLPEDYADDDTETSTDDA